MRKILRKLRMTDRKVLAQDDRPEGIRNRGGVR